MDCLKACFCGYANHMDELEESTRSVQSLEVPVQEQPQLLCQPIAKSAPSPTQPHLHPYDLPRAPTRRQHPIQPQALAQPHPLARPPTRQLHHIPHSLAQTQQLPQSQIPVRPSTRRSLPSFIEKDEVPQVEMDLPGLYGTPDDSNIVEVKEDKDLPGQKGARLKGIHDFRRSHEELLAESLAIGFISYETPTVLRGTGRLEAINSTDHPNMVIGAAPVVIVVVPKKKPTNSTSAFLSGSEMA